MKMSKENKNLSRSELISNFVITNPEYYIKEFKKIGSKPSYSFSFNLFASLLLKSFKIVLTKFEIRSKLPSASL